MNKHELITAISAKTGFSQRAVADILGAQAAQVQAALFIGEEAIVPGIGRFNVTARAARTGRNPQTGAEIHIPAKRVPTFTAGKLLKDALNA